MAETLQTMIDDGKRIANLFEKLTDNDKNMALVYLSALLDKELADTERAEKAGQEARKLIYVSERILNIQDLEKEIKNAALHFDILKKELKKTAPSSEIVDAAVYQISQSLEKANDFEFCLEQRKCEIKDAYENPRFAGNHQDAGNAD